MVSFEYKDADFFILEYKQLSARRLLRERYSDFSRSRDIAWQSGQHLPGREKIERVSLFFLMHLGSSELVHFTVFRPSVQLREAKNSA